MTGDRAWRRLYFAGGIEAGDKKKGRNSMKNRGRNGMKNRGRNGMKNRGRNGMKNGVRNGMKNGGRKCIRNGVLKRRVGLALSDTLSTQTCGQKKGEKFEPQNGENFDTKTGIIFVPAYSYRRPPGRKLPG